MNAQTAIIQLDRIADQYSKAFDKFMDELFATQKAHLVERLTKGAIGELNLKNFENGIFSTNSGLVFQVIGFDRAADSFKVKSMNGEYRNLTASWLVGKCKLIAA